MAEQRPSPFTSLGLDKALLRSTSPAQPAADDSARAEPAAPARPADPKPRLRPRLAAKPASLSDSVQDSHAASELASYPTAIVETIRKTVKTPGREVSFIRLSAHEKAALSELVYTFKRQGQRTTETEISRIAVNFILDDYQQHGSQSLLACVLAALQA